MESIDYLIKSTYYMKAALLLVKDVGSSQIVPDILIWQKKVI
jgi:hypothetical protein